MTIDEIRRLAEEDVFDLVPQPVAVAMVDVCETALYLEGAERRGYLIAATRRFRDARKRLQQSMADAQGAS